VPRSNDLVERALQEYADLLSIAGSDPYKPRAYEKAARAVGGYPEELAELDEAGVLSIPGVGRSIASKVVDILKTGSFDELDELRAQVPDGVRAMTAIPGFGPKKAMAVHVQLGIDTVEALAAAAERGELAGMKGFSRATERTVIDGVRRLRSSGGRVRVDQALEVAEELLGRLRQIPGVIRASYAGSMRRMAETIGDVDLLVASERPSSVMDALVGFDLTERVISHGETRSSIVTTSGLQVDLRVVDREAWGAALIYFTGSKAHNVRIREIAVRSGLKLNEYGLFRARSGKLLAAETEQAG